MKNSNKGKDTERKMITENLTESENTMSKEEEEEEELWLEWRQWEEGIRDDSGVIAESSARVSIPRQY